jgi:hypothetical protein
MAKPRKNHFLPEFYTRRWAGYDGKMVRFASKPSGEIEQRRVTPGGIGFERGLYTIPEQTDGNDQALEDGLFRLIDDFGGKALARLLAGDVPADIEARSKWAAFLLSLLFRGPRDIDASTKAFKLLIKSMYPAERDDEAAIRQLALRKLWTSINNSFLVGTLVQMHWEVIDFTNCGISLLTSDFPLILSNGLAPPEGNYALPLSPTHMFVTSWPGPQRTATLAAPRRQLAKFANRMIVERARHFVIASDDNQRRFVEKHFGARPVPSPVELLVSRYEAGMKGIGDDLTSHQE